MPESGNVCPGQSLLQSSELETQALSLDTLCSTGHVSSVTKSLQNKGNQANQTTHSPGCLLQTGPQWVKLCPQSNMCKPIPGACTYDLIGKNDPVDPFSPVASWEFVGESLREREVSFWGSELTRQLRLGLNSQSSCLNLPRTRATNMCSRTQSQEVHTKALQASTISQPQLQNSGFPPEKYYWSWIKYFNQATQ